MISRLSRRSVLDALTFGSGTTCRTSCSGGPDDVDHEVEGVGALDACIRGARLAVAVLWRDRHQYLATDMLADQCVVPALDHRTCADLEGGRGVAAEGLVERLLAVVHLAEVSREDGLALLYDGTGAVVHRPGVQPAV